MFKTLFAVAASIGAVRACTNATPLSTNPITSPSADDSPVIGQAFNVQWDTDYPNKGSTVTISLYNGCPGNCKELTDVVAGVQNTGSTTWTPSNTLTPGSDYAFLFINENPCMTVWTYFTLYAEGTAPNATIPAASSGASAAPSATSIASSGTSKTSAVASSGTSVASSAVSSPTTTKASLSTITPSSAPHITVTQTNTEFIFATTLSTVYVTTSASSATAT